MYSYSGPGGVSKKRLQLNQPQSLKLNFDASYAFDTEGRVTSVSYPQSGPTYINQFDSMGRLSGMTDQSNNPIVNSVSYNAANQLLSIYYGAVGENRTYNNMGQLTNVTVSGGLQNMNLTYAYPSGTNNGKISQMTDAISGEQVTYAYDSFNRLSGATAQGWSTTYGFDGFGNLTDKNNGGGAPSLQVSVDGTTNRINDGVHNYDANGNMIWSNGDTYGYDAENRLAYANPGTGGYGYYGYDSGNHRVFQWNGSVDQYWNASGYTVYVYGANGKRLASYGVNVVNGASLQAGVLVQETYFGGKRLAMEDRLGSTMLSTNGLRQGFFPYGEDKVGVGQPQGPNDAWKFATYWRDAATALDYADQRFYSNVLGRFLSPDRYVASAGTSDPSSWNRYAYTRNDPMNRVDVSGRADCTPSAGVDFSVTDEEPAQINDDNDGSDPYHDVDDWENLQKVSPRPFT